MTESAKILLVEDDPMNMELAADLLAVAGYGVLKATTAEAAMLLARAEQPDLVLMDIALPGMDGLEAMRRLRQDPRTAALPVVAFTASILESDQERIRQAGCHGIITKPIDTRRFAATVAALLASARAVPTP